MVLTFYFLFVVIHLTSSLNVDIPQPVYEFARGDTAVIPCNFIPQKQNNPSVIITWSAHPDNPADSDIDIETYYYSASGPAQEDVSDAYTGRASVQANIPLGQAPLTLKSLTSQDSRVYQCDVKILDDRKGKLWDTTTVVVLKAPSKPICAIQGRAEFNQNINLTCHSDEGVPVPTYKWQSYDVNNNSQPNPPKSTDVNGVLSLFNISKDNSGYYVCMSANKIRYATCNLTLAVMPQAPSKPICGIQGRAEFNQNIKLTSHSDEGVPVPTYKWQSYDVNNNPRPNPPKSTEANGVLSLFNISKDTDGYYVCTAANKIHSETCSLTLAVMPPSMNRRSTKRITEECAGNCQWCTQT